MMGYAFLRDDEVEQAHAEELDLELGTTASSVSADQSLAEICTWAEGGGQSFATSEGGLGGLGREGGPELSGFGDGLQSHAEERGDHGEQHSEAAQGQTSEAAAPAKSGGENAGGATVDSAGAKGSEAGAQAGGEGGAKAGGGDWRKGARSYNQEHAVLVEKFNAATQESCGSGADVDPEKVARWQREHGVTPDGRVGPRTFHAAKRISVASAARASKEAGASGASGAGSASTTTTTIGKPPTADTATTTTGAAQGMASSSATTTDAGAGSGAATLPSAQLQEALRLSYARILKLFSLGQTTEQDAVARLLAADKKLGGGKPSAESVLLIPFLLADLAKLAMKRAQTALASFAGAGGDDHDTSGGGAGAGSKSADAGKSGAGTQTAPAVGEPYSGVYTAGSGDDAQQCQVYVSPGGVTATPDLFLFFHGHRAQYNIDDKQTKKGEISGLDVAADAMTHARGKNVIAILPQGKLGGSGKGDRTKEGGYMSALQAGLPAFLSSILGPLAKDLQMPGLTPRHISLAGHSAGGYMGIHDALTGAGDLADEITDVTLMDTGYSTKHFSDTSKWMYSGGPGKSVRIIGSYKQIKDTQLHEGAFGKSGLSASAKKHGCTVEHLGVQGDQRDKDTKVVQHSRVMKDGAVQCDVLILMFDKYHDAGRDHAPMRDRVMDDAILSIGEGSAGNEDFGFYDKGVEVEHDEDDAHDDGARAPDVHVESKPKASGTAGTAGTLSVDSHAADASKKAAPKKLEAQPETKADAPKKGAGSKKKKTAYDSTNGVDSFGNLTERDTSTKGQKSKATTFANSFTVVAEARLHNEKHKDLKKTLPKGSEVRVVDMDGAWVQVTCKEPAYTEADDVWMKFTSLGGTGSDIGLGNEKSDAKDKERADKIREGLPEGRKPGESKFKWAFGGSFMPSMDGVSLSGGLMSKVNALMEWAIENDMVLGNISIGSGMRSPKAAHKLCVRYEIANMDNNRKVTLAALQALPDGKDADGNKWYEAGWTAEQAMEHARGKKGRGSVAAAGYDLGDARRAPLPLNGRPGVSNHCSGHAVDVNIPWRSADDPNKQDVWAWEHIYHQFGLTRPLHRDRGVSATQQEHWHIEETGKDLEVEGEAE